MTVRELSGREEREREEDRMKRGKRAWAPH
jgi:hypothetical protein